MFGSMRTGIRAWEKGEKNIEIQQRYRIILNMLKRQLSSMCLGNITYTREPFYLKGSEKHIEFVSNRSLLSGNEAGHIYVEYRVSSPDMGGDTAHFSVFERNFILINSGSGDFKPDTDDFVELTAGFHSITFNYLKENKEDETFEWVDEWWAKDKNKFPKAVKITLFLEDGGLPLSIIASVHSESEW